MQLTTHNNVVLLEFHIKYANNWANNMELFAQIRVAIVLVNYWRQRVTRNRKWKDSRGRRGGGSNESTEGRKFTKAKHARRKKARMMEYHIKSISNNTNTKEYSWKKEDEKFSRNVVREREKWLWKIIIERERSFI